MEKEHENSTKNLNAWEAAIKQNIYQNDEDFKHSIALYLAGSCPQIDQELTAFAEIVIRELDPLVVENNLALNLPRIDHYDAVGNQVDQIVHHPSYEAAGNIIYQSRLLERMAKPGGMLEALAFMFLSSQTGEAGHNCPVACSAGIIRILQRTGDFPLKSFYLQKLQVPSYTHNFTGAQFLTELQGGSDVGQNATEAYKDEQGIWRIRGEKWFCSNADAELILVTARFDKSISGTKGLGLFLVPARLESGERNGYTIRRLKDKIGTRSMATAEIDFEGAYAVPMGSLADGFKMVMENVLHVSRMFNTFCVLGMARRAYHIAYAYANHRVAFGNPIIHYPLVKEKLAGIKTENTALLASIFATVKLQDDFDAGRIKGEETKLLLRLLVNINKYISALWSVEHIHHALDTLAGNGAIESFSIIPRLLRDCIVCENWEGTHNVLRMQALKDITRYHVDDLFLQHIETILGNIEADKEYLDTIRKGIGTLRKALQAFRSATPDLQSLQIKSIFDQMAILYSALQLLFEAADQAGKGNYSKFHCLDYLLDVHLTKAPLDYDQRDLELINAVMS